jgi:hypothetical protein
MDAMLMMEPANVRRDHFAGSQACAKVGGWSGLAGDHALPFIRFKSTNGVTG